MKKKGVTQVDWVISLSIFLLFLALFFIYARHTLFTSTEVTDYTDQIIKNFKEESFTSITEHPLLITSSTNQSKRSIITDFPFSQNPTLLEDKYFSVDEGKLIFLDDLSQGKNIRKLTFAKYILGNATQPEPFEADPNMSKSGSTTAYFTGASLDRLEFNGQDQITDFQIQINNQKLVPDQETFTSSKIHSKYKMTSQILDHSSLFVAMNPELTGIIKAKDNKPNKKIRIKITTKTYPNYYSDNSFFGNLNYNISNILCITHENDYINLYGDKAISIKFTKKVNITLCAGNNLEIYADFDLDDMEYKIRIFKEDDKISISDFEDYKSEIGHAEKIELLDEQKLLALNTLSYEDIKSKWGFFKDFSIAVTSHAGARIYSTRNEPYQFAQVNSKRVLAETVPDLSGKKKQYYILIKTW